jgi:hypothetical protein
VQSRFPTLRRRIHAPLAIISVRDDRAILGTRRDRATSSRAALHADNETNSNLSRVVAQREPRDRLSVELRRFATPLCGYYPSDAAVGTAGAFLNFASHTLSGPKVCLEQRYGCRD